MTSVLVLANVKDRKRQFEAYCKQRSSELRQKLSDSHQSKTQNLQQTYINFLQDKIHDERTHWDDFARRYRKDPKFLALPDERERRTLFKEHLSKLGDKRKEEKKKLEEGFKSLLKEWRVHDKSLWKDVWKYYIVFTHIHLFISLIIGQKGY